MTIREISFVALPFIVAIVVNKLLQRFIRVPKNLDSARTATYITVLKSMLTFIIYAIAGYMTFQALKIDMTPVFASAGVLGIIIGLGLRSFIEDIFTGIFILTEDTIRVGDYVDIGGSEGITESLGLRTVRIRDKNGAVHIFPNREIKKIINYSKRQARVIADFPIKSNQPLDGVLTALGHAMSEIKKDKRLGQYIQENSRIEGVEAINPGHVVVRVLILTRASERWNAARTFRKLALQELEKANILLA
ncbi:mechanosensitive ion channel family protein [Patescibacteria group bacterium]|nr:mechanosensitive ion channel family protein [Patescibacteria group bacterium]